jgi:hypothetical protein
MLLHSVVLIAHITAVFVLCSVLSIEALCLVYLRRALTLDQAHPWIEPVRRLRVFAVGSVLLIQFSGIYLVYRASSFGQGWAMIAMGAFPLLMAPFGNMTARRMRAIREALRSKEKTEADLLGMLRAPFLKLSLGIRVEAFLGIFVLVSMKPGPLAAVSLLVTSLSLALLLSFSPWRR